MSEPKVVNIVQDGEKVLVTIRYPDTDEHYGYDAIYEGSMEDVMILSLEEFMLLLEQEEE
tara:strand:+ start:66 stop:245 length:180 start_codon:yes stop_codon:yes gene_type:complete